jgi:hypothetical protein
LEVSNADERTPINRTPRSRITPEMIALYRRMVDEPDPRKQFALDRKLRDLLGFPVWQRTFIGDTIGYEGDEPSADVGQDEFRIREWREARELRRRLDAAANAAFRGGA